MKKSLLLMVCLLNSMLVVATGDESDSRKRSLSTAQEDGLLNNVSELSITPQVVAGRYEIVGVLRGKKLRSAKKRSLNPSIEESHLQSSLFNEHFAHLNQNEQQD